MEETTLLAAYHNRVKEKIYALLQEEKRIRAQFLSYVMWSMFLFREAMLQANGDWL